MRFSSSKNVREEAASRGKKKKPQPKVPMNFAEDGDKQNNLMLADIPESNEGAENDQINAMEIPDKPSYFNMFDEEEINSEEDLVAGENNYIEIECLPLAGAVPP